MVEYVPLYLRVGPFVEAVWEPVYVPARRWVLTDWSWVLA
jgi:hypothetical protein